MPRYYFSATVLIATTLSVTGALAQEEPWGGNVPGWKFTQSGIAGGAVNCRATQGTYIIARLTDGRAYVSSNPPAGLPRGRYRDGRGTVIFAGKAEPIDAEVSNRLVFHIGDSALPALIRARGYQWRVAGPKGVVTGSVSFSGDIAKVIAEVRACAKANTAAARPKPGPQAGGANPKWSGVWSWVRPLVLNFGGRPAPPPPGPQDVTVRERMNATLEVLPNNRARICIASNPCGVHPFSFGNGAYNIDFHSGFIAVIPNDQGRTLNGQMWWQKQNRTRTTPDATFVLRR